MTTYLDVISNEKETYLLCVYKKYIDADINVHYTRLVSSLFSEVIKERKNIK